MGFPTGNTLPPSTAMAADLDRKVRSLLMEAEQEDEATSHTFAQRAEAYYHQRPHLLSLLRHLHSSYLSHLSHRHLPPSSSSDGFEDDFGSAGCLTSFSTDSDADSTVFAYSDADRMRNVVDRMVEEVVMSNVQIHILTEEEAGGSGKKQAAELRRKVELQTSLVEVLESERLILLKENAGLRYDNEALAWEAGEVGRCLMRMRREERRRALVMERRIDELRQQICGLESRNREYKEEMLAGRKNTKGKSRWVKAAAARWRGRMRGLSWLSGGGRWQRRPCCFAC